MSDVLTKIKIAREKCKNNKQKELEVKLTLKDLDFIYCSLVGQYAFDDALSEALGIKTK